MHSIRPLCFAVNRFEWLPCMPNCIGISQTRKLKHINSDQRFQGQTAKSVETGACRCYFLFVCVANVGQYIRIQPFAAGHLFGSSHAARPFYAVDGETNRANWMLGSYGRGAWSMEIERRGFSRVLESSGGGRTPAYGVACWIRKLEYKKSYLLHLLFREVTWIPENDVCHAVQQFVMMWFYVLHGLRVLHTIVYDVMVGKKTYDEILAEKSSVLEVPTWLGHFWELLLVGRL